MAVQPVVGSVDDLATLSVLTEATLVDEVEARFVKGNFYTYIGDILLAMNPHKETDLYGSEVLAKYGGSSVTIKVLPHVFAVSRCAWQRMSQHADNQCCVVSGESGSGKTETTKYLVQHIMRLCRQSDNRDLHNKILEINPLLEAFGNARTTLNDNSSRFGKYIELRFDQTGQIRGAVIFEYMLEKSRVVQQAPGESNFHIFYALFAGIGEDKRLSMHLDSRQNHRIINPSDGSSVFSNRKSMECHRLKWEKILNILASVGFSSEQINGIIEILTAIVHITELKFARDKDTDGVYILNEQNLEVSARLLQISINAFGGAMVVNETKVVAEIIISLKTLHQAESGRDALAKALYGRLFGWIVRQINASLCEPSQRSEENAKLSTVGILDIYGFENCLQNSFEQLCINVANEQLQLYFSQQVFQSELEEYAREGVSGLVCSFRSNQSLIDLFMEPWGLYALLDEESKFPRATDLTLITKLSKQLSRHKEFEMCRGKRMLFLIHHYAGSIIYNVTGFLEKNRDTLSTNLADCLKKSTSVFVADLFKSSTPGVSSLTMHRSGVKAESRKAEGHGVAASNARGVTMRQKPAAIDNQNNSESTRTNDSITKRHLRESFILAHKSTCDYEYTYANIKTLASYFKISLNELLHKIRHAQPHFIRCVRPNAEKKPNVFDRELVLKQFRYTGVLATVQIRRLGFAVRLPFATFINRYGFVAFLLDASVVSPRSKVLHILKAAEIVEFEIGKTKVFLKYYHVDKLNARLCIRIKQVIHCQKFFRSFAARKNYFRLRLVSYEPVLPLMIPQVIKRPLLKSATGQAAQKRHDLPSNFRDRPLSPRQNGLVAGAKGALNVIWPPKDQTELPSLRPDLPQNQLPVGHTLHKLDTLRPVLSANVATQKLNILSPTLTETGPSTSRPDLPQNQLPVGHNLHKLDTLRPVLSANVAAQKLNILSPTLTKLLPSSQGLTHQLPVEQTFLKLDTLRPGFSPNVEPSKIKNSPLKLTEMKRSRKQDLPPELPPRLDQPKGSLSRLPARQLQATDSLLEELLEATMCKFPSLPQQFWGKLHCVQSGRLLAKFLLEDDVICIDNSTNEYNGRQIGLDAYPTMFDENGKAQFLAGLGKGLKINRNPKGDIFACKFGPCGVVSKGYRDSANNCLSEEILECFGHLGPMTVKIFDMERFKVHLAKELGCSEISIARFERLSSITICILVNDGLAVQIEPPIENSFSVNIVNFAAIDLLGNSTVFDELLKLGGLRLTTLERMNLEKTWASLKRPRTKEMHTSSDNQRSSSSSTEAIYPS